MSLLATQFIGFGVASSAVTPATYTYTASTTFVVPAYNTMVVEVVGGGGAGGGEAGNGSGVSGTLSKFDLPSGTDLVSNPGNNGQDGNTSTPGSGGTATGGDTNTTGNSGSGSVGGTSPGGLAPYGNGCNADSGGGGGGSAGYCKKTYTAGDIAVGTTVTITIGSAGTSPGGNFGGGGKIVITIT